MLSSHPVISQGLYFVDTLEGYRWCQPGIAHGLPPGGLVVVRELCQNGSYEAKWFGADALPWSGIKGDAPCDVLMKPISPDVTSEVGDFQEAAPTVGSLKFFKALSQASESPVVYYRHHTWGGDTEYEEAWLFGKNERLLTFVDNEHFTEQRIGLEAETQAGSILSVIMREFGLVLPSPFFALHARPFPWAQYKVTGTFS